MKPLVAHTVTVVPWRGFSTYSRVLLEAGTAALWPLQPDDRLSVLINLLASEVVNIAESDDQVDAIVEILSMHLKMTRRLSTPPQGR